MSHQNVMSQTDKNAEAVITDEAEIEKILSEEEVEDAPNSDEIDYKALYEKSESIKSQLVARLRKEKGNKKPIEKLKDTEPDDDIRQTVAQLALAEQKRQFGYENGLSPQETDHIFRINQKPTKEILEDPFIKGGLQAIRAKNRVDSNTPSGSNRTPKFALPKKENLTSDDKQSAFETFMASKRK